MRSEKGQGLENGQKDDERPFVRIPYDQLSPDTVTAVIEEYVTRAGTDYGEKEIPFDQQIIQIKKYLKAGTAFIVFNKETMTCSIVLRDNFKETEHVK